MNATIPLQTVILKDTEHPLSSPNTACYAAAVTSGGKLAPQGYFHAVGRGGAEKSTPAGDHVVVWLLQNIDLEFKPFAGERITQKQFIDRWHDDAWLAEHPDHPITFMRYLLENLNAARDFIKKNKPLLQIHHGRRTAFISQDETPERRAELMRLLKAK